MGTDDKVDILRLYLEQLRPIMDENLPKNEEVKTTLSKNQMKKARKDLAVI